MSSGGTKYVGNGPLGPRGRRIELASGSLLITEDGATKALTVTPKRTGVQIGCTWVSYEALDKIVELTKE
jgi:hypothetical protein